MQQTILAHCGMVFVATTFSLWNVVGDTVLRRGFDAIVLATYREVGTAACLIVASLACSRQLKWPAARESLLFAACGIFGVFGLQFFFILGLRAASADSAALIQSLTPVITLLVGAALGIERFDLCASESSVWRASWSKAIGVVVSVAGCVLFSIHAESANSSPLSGMLYLLLSDFGCAAFILTQKPLFAAGYSSLYIITVAYTVGAACMAVAAAIIRPPLAAWAISADEVLLITFVILVCGAADYAILTWSNSRLEAVIVSLYGILQPLVTALLSFIIQGETVASLALVGGAFVLLGLILTSLAGPIPTLLREAAPNMETCLLASELASDRQMESG
mmetsp:Transcript_29389/g.48727  ORF Transcript_29389/g.48727 Transcript_29389/m.48727 type:complete len:337 (+) Transcript_29389:202-1212(+)|eukprot:CAMPEP_0119311436 /NCGR_PEP_ID=MMETSP1333-20130426/22417_1 /TAXON_ID=418940 /ORGANISM="Scyphosphaera apsteinii, Strain RCC1455" /LENGTH=336 /DNA_ID=CAMNT_0007315805 /DNA_START=212 /DNA_END=1222 /DNA_ORIENTATION=+